MSLSKVHLPPKVLVIPRMLWLRPDMTEKLFTGTLSKRKKKRKTCKPELARTPGFGPTVFFSSFFSEYWENIPHKISFWIARHK